jgi:metallo-beta-lactamase family protein
MFQGTQATEALNQAPLGFEPGDVSGVVVTHAHLDHCGRLPLLTRGGFEGDIYMTPATRDLIELALIDAAKIQAHEREAAWFTMEDVMEVLARIRLVEYHQTFELAGFSLYLVDAGHILGSASVVIRARSADKRYVFSGDLGNTPQDLIRPTEYIGLADTVVMESTYGDRDHPPEDAGEVLRQEITAVEHTGGTLLIPAFSLERTQEVLHVLDHLKKKAAVSPDTPVFLDSPMAIRATRIFRRFAKLYNRELQRHKLQDDPFDFPGLELTIEQGESEAIANVTGPKVIIAGSGMMTGGRIIRHAAHYLPELNTRLLFVGYQGVETLGRKILEGIKRVEINEKMVEVRAHVREVSALSSHAGQSQLLTWLRKITGVKTVYLVHGDEPQRMALEMQILKTCPNMTVELPKREALG